MSSGKLETMKWVPQWQATGGVLAALESMSWDDRWIDWKEKIRKLIGIPMDDDDWWWAQTMSKTLFQKLIKKRGHFKSLTLKFTLSFTEFCFQIKNHHSYQV